jgi:hypothetical protein
MNRLWLAVCLTATLTALEFIPSGEAFARGGAANIMNSPGYQRRLQESRGYVSNQSGSISLHSHPTPGTPKHCVRDTGSYTHLRNST